MLFALIGALFVFLIWGRYRDDLVACGALSHDASLELRCAEWRESAK